MAYRKDNAITIGPNTLTLDALLHQNVIYDVSQSQKG